VLVATNVFDVVQDEQIEAVKSRQLGGPAQITARRSGSLWINRSRIAAYSLRGNNASRRRHRTKAPGLRFNDGNRCRSSVASCCSKPRLFRIFGDLVLLLASCLTKSRELA